MTENIQDSSGYEPYEEQQPVQNLLNSLLLPNPALFPQMTGAWPSNSTWNHGQNENGYQGYYADTTWASQSYANEQDDSNGDDFYSPATPHYIHVADNGQPSSDYQVQSNALQGHREEVATAESFNQAPVRRNQSLPPASTPVTLSSNLDAKQVSVSTIAPSERALELKKQLLSRQKRANGTATPEKTGVKSPTPTLSDNNPSTDKNGLHKAKMPDSEGVSSKIVESSRSATILARLEGMKSGPKPKIQSSGLEPKVLDKSSESQNGVAVNGHSITSHLQPMQPLTRTDSSMTVEDLIAEERVKVDGTMGHSESVEEATAQLNMGTESRDKVIIPASLVSDKSTGVEAKRESASNQRAEPSSAESLEQGEIHEEPVAGNPQAKPPQIPTKPSENPRNFKDRMQPARKMPPKKRLGCYQCHQYFDQDEDLDKHIHVVHGKNSREKRIYERPVQREDEKRSDFRSRDEMSGPDRLLRPWVDRRNSDDRYDRAPEPRNHRDLPSRDRLRYPSKSRQAEIDQETRRGSLSMGTPTNSTNANVKLSAKDQKIDEVPQAQQFQSTSKRSSEALPTQVEEWLRMTDYYDLDEAKREAKLARWRRQRAISEERERLELEEQKEREELAQAKAKAKLEKLARTASTLSTDREQAIPGAPASPKLNREAVSQPMLPPAMPAVPDDDDVGMRIKDSAMRSAETSPTQPTFPPPNLHPLTSSPSLKRRFPTDNQSPNGQSVEKLARLETRGRDVGPTTEEPYSATQTHPMDLDDPRSREISPRGGERQRFRSRSPVRRRDSDYQLQYEDAIDDRVPFRSRDASRDGRYEEGRYDSWKPVESNANERPHDHSFDGRPRGGHERRDYQPYAGRGYRGSRGGGFQRGGYVPRSGRGRNNDRERG